MDRVIVLRSLVTDHGRVSASRERQHFETGDVRKLGDVGCEHGIVVSDGCGGDPEIVGTHHLAARDEISELLRVNARGRFIHRQNWDCGQNRFHESGSPSFSFGRVRAMHADQQFRNW